MYVASFGGLARFQYLLTFAGALKGVLFAINSNEFAAILQRAHARQRFEISVSNSDVILILLATPIAINIGASLVGRIHFSKVTKL